MEAVIYSNGNQECERAKTLLEKLNFQIHVYKLNQHFSARGFVEEFGDKLYLTQGGYFTQDSYPISDEYLSGHSGAGIMQKDTLLGIYTRTNGGEMLYEKELHDVLKAFDATNDDQFDMYLLGMYLIKAFILLLFFKCLFRFFGIRS